MDNIKEVLHLYMCCDVITASDMSPLDSGIKGKLVTLNIRHGIGIIEINDGGQTISKLISEFKLVLRRLSSMSEEEAQEIAKIMYGQPDSVKWRMEDKGTYFNVYRKHYHNSFTIDKVTGDIDRYTKDGGQQELETTLQHHYITAYMLKCGFWLFSPDAWEKGLIIDKDTVK